MKPELGVGSGARFAHHDKTSLIMEIVWRLGQAGNGEVGLKNYPKPPKTTQMKMRLRFLGPWVQLGLLGKR